MFTNQHSDEKVTIVGGGIIGALEAYFAYLAAKRAGRKIRVTIFDKNEKISDTTASNIAPSLTPDEIVAVVPPVNVLLEKLGVLFNDPNTLGGVRVDDVPGVNDSTATKNFLSQVEQSGRNQVAHQNRTNTLLELGKRSMALWQKIYEEADSELKQIFKDSNFNPCHEPSKSTDTLHDGYRIDLMYNTPNARTEAEGMKSDYEKLEYMRCKILSPAEVKAMDPTLSDFCDKNSEKNAENQLIWKNNAVALYRPGGCLSAEAFLPKFYDYLTKVMGKYSSENGEEKNCFRIKFQRPVNGVQYAENSNQTVINGLKYARNVESHAHSDRYKNTEYVFCPGEKVGTLEELGFAEPAYASFAGASLKLNIPIPKNVSAQKLEEYAKFNHCMEVHDRQKKVVLAWQAGFKKGDESNTVFINVAGTKAYYADKKPNKDEAFAKDRNLLQLNMINQVLPEFISMALNRNTKDQTLTETDLKVLEDNGIAKRWAGTRAVGYDGFPTIGTVHNAHGQVKNGRVTTQLGSGGVSFGPAAVLFSRGALGQEKLQDDAFTRNVIDYGSSKRTVTVK